MVQGSSKATPRLSRSQSRQATPRRTSTAAARDDEFQIDVLNRAAWQLEDAIFGRTVQQYPGNVEAARLTYFDVLKATKQYNKALLGLVFITFVEVPAWCDTMQNTWSFLPGSKRCAAPGGAMIYLSGIPYLPPCFGILFEVICLFYIMRKHRKETRLQVNYFDRVEVEYVDLPATRFGQWCVILAFADLAMFAFMRPKYRFAFLARTGLLCLLPPVRNLGEIIIQALSEFVSVAVFLLGTISFFAWIAVTIFDDIKSYNINNVKVNTGLDTLSNALNTMFVAGATDSFVDCFLPSYTFFRWTGVLWLFFLIIVQVLLLNLVLDTLVAAYNRHAEKSGEQGALTQVKGILFAWDTICMLAHRTLGEEQKEEKEINKTVFLEFIEALSASPRLIQIPRHVAEVVFAAVDEDGSALISREEFCKICSVIQSQFWITKRDSVLKEKYPNVWSHPAFQWLREKVSSGSFDVVMNVVLGVNFCLVLAESRCDLMGWPQPVWMDYAELSFSFMYVGEVAVRLSIVSFESYWSARANWFDFSTTWLLLSTSVMNFAAQGTRSLSRYANILRLLRLLRVLKQLKSQPEVSFMVNTIGRMVTASREILTVLAVVVFFFATLSVQLFGGLVYDANPRLEGADILETKWTIFNFNDIIQALALWIIVLLCEYVPSFADAVHLVSDIPYSWLIFPIFYLVGVSIMFELVKAFTIEIFIEIHTEEAKRKAEGQPMEEEMTDALQAIHKQFEMNDEVLWVRKAMDSLEEERLEKAFEEELHTHEGHGEQGHGEHGHGGHGHDHGHGHKD